MIIILFIVDYRLRKICDNEYLNMNSYESIKLWMGPYVGENGALAKIMSYSDLTYVII